MRLKPKGYRTLVLHDRTFYYAIGRLGVKIVDAFSEQGWTFDRREIFGSDKRDDPIVPRDVTAFVPRTILGKEPPTAEPPTAKATESNAGVSLPVLPKPIWYIIVKSRNPDSGWDETDLHMICDDPQFAKTEAARLHDQISMTVALECGLGEVPLKRRRTEGSPGIFEQIKKDPVDLYWFKRDARPRNSVHEAVLNRPI
jgi:hypothetical protein